MADLERGQRIKALREDMHLTQPAVVELLERAARKLPADHPLHPERAGKPPVTLRGLQTWEGGGGIAWEKAKLLSGVLDTDVAHLVNGATTETPDPFQGASVDERLDRIEAMLAELLRRTPPIEPGEDETDQGVPGPPGGLPPAEPEPGTEAA